MIMVAVDCWIIRLQCIKEETGRQFVVTEANKMLENHVIRSLKTQTKKDCEIECFDEFTCKSINWSSDKICELNKGIKQTAAPDDFKSRIGWSYSSTNYDTKNVSIWNIKHCF